MQVCRLEPHQAHPPLAVTAIEARITHDDRNWLGLRWRIETASELVLPEPAGKRREDGLWQATSF